MSTWPETGEEEDLFKEWQHEVRNGDTILGFRDWIAHDTEVTRAGGYCEDYPCCGHTNLDPCPGRGSGVQEPWYCDTCGVNHINECGGW